MNEPLRMSPEPSRGFSNDSDTAMFFRWIVGGVLTVVAALASILWFMLMGQMSDLKTSASQVAISVYDMKADIKLLSARTAEQSDQLSEMRGFLRKKSPQ
jgi:hypothetical protein